MVDFSGFSNIERALSPPNEDDGLSLLEEHRHQTLSGPVSIEDNSADGLSHNRLMPRSLLDEISFKSSPPKPRFEKTSKFGSSRKTSPTLERKRPSHELQASPLRKSSQKRRVAERSPVSVNTQYELTLRNTR